MSTNKTSIISSILDLPKMIGQGLVKVQTSLQELFRINPIIKQKLGFMNTLILISGLSLVLFYFQTTIIDSRNALILLVIATSLFMWSVIYNSNPYIHTIISAFTAFLGVKLVSYFGILLFPNAFITVLLILLLITVYMDLLKPNFVLQLASIGILTRVVLEPFISTNPTLKMGPITKFDLVSLINTFFPLLEYIIDNISGFAVYGVLILPLFWFINSIYYNSNRIIFSKFYNIILHFSTFMSLLIIILTGSNIQVIIGLTLLLLVSFISFIIHKYTIGRIYLIGFILSLTYFVYSSDVFGSVINQGLVSISLLSILIMTLIGKTIIDNSNKL
jgi:hypothetical protein